MKKLEKIGKNAQIIGALDVKSHTKFQPNISILTGPIEFLKFESRDLILGQWAILNKIIIKIKKQAECTGMNNNSTFWP